MSTPVGEVIEVSAADDPSIIEVDGEVVVVSDGATLVIEVGYMQPGGDVGDKNFEMAFSSSTAVAVEHNLNKLPAVTVINTFDEECKADVEYIDDNNIIVTFKAAESGIITCN